MSRTAVRPQTVEFDHNSPQYAQQWRDIYSDLRQRCPVAHSEAYGGFYVLSRYKDVERALKDDDTFASHHSTEEGSPFGGILIPPSPNVSTPIEMDPPDFTPLRRLLNPYFSPGKADEWEPFTRDVTTGLIDQVIETGHVDLVDHIASPVPALLTAALLGLPLEDWRMYSEVAHAIVYTPPADPRFMDVVMRLQEIHERATKVGLQRRDDPKDDLLSAIATYRDAEGNLLPEHRITEFCSLIIGGGNDTTTSLLSQAFMWLSEHPEQRDWLRQDLGRVKAACEEFLRYFTPTQALARTVRKPVEIAGYELQPGDRVLLSFASANQDPEEFDNPDEIVLDRFPNRHQAFGLGLHRCLGSNFTRMEFRVVLEEVLERLPDFVVDRSGSARYESIGIVNGWATMPAAFTPGSRKGSTFQP
jgi:cytochrome P450